MLSIFQSIDHPVVLLCYSFLVMALTVFISGRNDAEIILILFNRIDARVALLHLPDEAKNDVLYALYRGVIYVLAAGIDVKLNENMQLSEEETVKLNNLVMDLNMTCKQVRGCNVVILRRFLKKKIFKIIERL